MAEIPTVEAFRAHEAQRGPWMRVKVNGAWVQARVRVVDPREWKGWHGGGELYLHAVLFTSPSHDTEGASRTVQHCHTFASEYPGDCPEWEWCDADGLPVPDIRPASELTTERLNSWSGGWMAEIPMRGWESWTSEGIRAHVTCGVTWPCYPIRNNKPWRPAGWSEVDAAVAARKEKT